MRVILVLSYDELLILFLGLYSTPCDTIRGNLI